MREKFLNDLSDAECQALSAAYGEDNEMLCNTIHKLNDENAELRAQLEQRKRIQDFTKWQHARTGGVYVEIARGLIEANLEPVVIYRGDDGLVWVRLEAEFMDGRFLLLEKLKNVEAKDQPAQVVVLPKWAKEWWAVHFIAKAIRELNPGITFVAEK